MKKVVQAFFVNAVFIRFASSSFAGLVCFGLITPGLLRADGDPREEVQIAPQAEGLSKSSAANFDKRLPPVIPGEILVDGQGQKLRVMSTSGNVNTFEAPLTPPAPPVPPTNSWQANQVPGSLNIVVDREERAPLVLPPGQMIVTQPPHTQPDFPRQPRAGESDRIDQSRPIEDSQKGSLGSAWQEERSR